MNIAYITFDGITWLDMMGVYDPVSRLKSLNYLPDLTCDICAFTDTVEDRFGLEVIPTRVGCSLAGYDAVIVPGGCGTRTLQRQPEFIAWLQTAAPATYKIAVCTGSQLLGAAGFLRGKRATTNPKQYEALRSYCQQVLTDRIVDDNNTITASGVTASLDLGLYLCHKWSGPAAASNIRERMAYTG